LRYGYKMVRRPEDLQPVLQHLNERFARREEQDIARLRKVVALAECGGCYTRYLLEYFGEQRENCGHCSRCAGGKKQIMPPTAGAAVDGADRATVKQLIAERHHSLRSPRQIARFLCGITSPATTKAKLRKHAAFGRLESVPFAQVLALAESAAG
jgi:ATP-dependent DNA helicase RecQ